MSEEIVHPQGSWVAVKLGLVGKLGLFRQPLPMHRAGGTPGKGPGSLRVGHLRSCSLHRCTAAISVGCTTAAGHRLQALGNLLSPYKPHWPCRTHGGPSREAARSCLRPQRRVPCWTEA